MDLDLAKQVALLLSEKRHLETRLREVKESIAEIEPSLVAAFAENGMDRIQVPVEDGAMTVYVQQNLFVRPKDGDRASVVSCLKRCGLSDLVSESYNAQTLSAYVRERLAAGVGLQPSLAKNIEVYEETRVRARASHSPESTTRKAIRNLRNQ